MPDGRARRGLDRYHVAVFGRIADRLRFYAEPELSGGQFLLRLRLGLSDEIGRHDCHCLATGNVEGYHGAPWFQVALRRSRVSHVAGFDVEDADGDYRPRLQVVGLQLGAGLGGVQALEVGYDDRGQTGRAIHGYGGALLGLLPGSGDGGNNPAGGNSTAVFGDVPITEILGVQGRVRRVELCPLRLGTAISGAPVLT